MPGICGECANWADGCTKMRDADVLAVVPTNPTTPCPIGKFEGRSDLSLGEPEEIISQREFARLVGVSQASIWEAIETGRLTATAEVRRGSRTDTRVYRDRALAQWNAIRPEPVITPEPAPAAKVDTALFEEDESPGKLKTIFEARRAELQCQDLEMKIAETQGRLHDASDIEAAWTAVLSTFKTRLRALPSELAPVMAARLKSESPPSAAELMQMLLDGIDSALADLASANFTTDENRGAHIPDTDEPSAEND